jgi:XTP/dITP diphosphohydrolase
MKKIVFASKNRGKIKEVKHILQNSEIELISLLDFEDFQEIEETGTTFRENAVIKAETVFAKLGIPAIGDDSGLSVDQLGGRPGVYSARYAGESATDEENNKKLIEELKNYPEPHPAKFVCTAVYYDGRDYITAAGEVLGRIIKEPRGKNGFGYDPYFLPDGYKVTTAEMPLEEKNKISHRSKAFNELKKLIIK